MTQHLGQFLLYRKSLAIAANICCLVYLLKLTQCNKDLTPNAISLRAPKIHPLSMTEVKNPREERPRKRQARAQNAITFTLPTILLTLRMFSESAPTHAIPSQSHRLPPNSPWSLPRPSLLPPYLINLGSEWSTLDLSYFGSLGSRCPRFLLSLGWVARSWQRSDLSSLLYTCLYWPWGPTLTCWLPSLMLTPRIPPTQWHLPNNLHQGLTPLLFLLLPGSALLWFCFALFFGGTCFILLCFS